MNTSGKLALEIASQDVIQMDAELFPNPWTQKQWEELDLAAHKLFTFRDGPELIGWALFGVNSYDDAAHLYKVLIAPSKRGLGATQVFWSEILLELKKLNLKSIYLEVESSNLRAIAFYQKEGFSLLRTNKAYYSNGEDALIMSLML